MQITQPEKPRNRAPYHVSKVIIWFDINFVSPDRVAIYDTVTQASIEVIFLMLLKLRNDSGLFREALVQLMAKRNVAGHDIGITKY